MNPPIRPLEHLNKELSAKQETGRYILYRKLPYAQEHLLIQERNPFLEPKTTRKTALNTEIKETVAILRNFFCIPCVLQFPLGLLKILCLKCIFKI
ncbi:hypothetical protein AVEN_91224-1 [Araneus ventricosus]|uniref:Uncharacterized protein n=1 Tax=Araneus ventricosus TaxID=182803 RepID=A0A4Y2T1E6_ARAVE|nr:hypothetical protein AVEN_91224-1 [Araneus ventricosus]